MNELSLIHALIKEFLGKDGIKVTYLGDNVYATYGGTYEVWLFTLGEKAIVNAIYLSTDTWHSLMAFKDSMRAELAKEIRAYKGA